MRPLTLALSALALVVGRAAAQQNVPTGGRSRLSLAITGGLTTKGALWQLDRTLLPVRTGGIDTLALRRLLRPGMSFGLLTTYFPDPRAGWTVEAAWIGALTEGRCEAIGGFRPDPEQINQQACSDVTGKHANTGVFILQAGGIVRLLPNRAFEPYVRAAAGLGALGGPWVRSGGMVASTQCGGTCLLVVVDDGPYSRLTPTASFAAGASIAFQPGLRVRLEARDLLARLPIPVAAPPLSDPLLRAPVELRLRHVVTITAGLEVLMERTHRRRY